MPIEVEKTETTTETISTVNTTVTKDIVKQAIKEWLDDQFIAFGKWTLRSLSAAAFAVLLYFYFKLQAGK